MIEIDLTAYQAVQPTRAYRKALSEDMDVAAAVGTADEDHAPAYGRARIERNAAGYRSTRRRAFCQHSGACTMSGNVLGGAALQLGQSFKLITRPHLGLPQGIETFDGVLHAVLEWSNE